MKESFEAEGEVTSLDLLAAFCSVGRQGSTGKTIFSRGDERIVFVFERGVLVDLESPGESSAAEVLIRSGKIQRETYDALVIPSGEDRFAIATASGVISRKEASWGRKLSAIESLAHLLSWSDGRYRFEPLVPDTGQGFRLPVDKWILELFLRSDDRSLVLSRIGPTDLPLVKSETFAPEFSGLGLTADADAVAALVDGSRSVEQIVRKARAEEFAVLKLLAALMSLGLVRPSYESAAPPVANAVLAPEPPPEEPPGAEEAPFEDEVAEPAFEPEVVEPAFEPEAVEPSPPEPEAAPIALPLFALTALEPTETESVFETEPAPPDEPVSKSRGRGGFWAGFIVLAAAISFLLWKLGGTRPPAPKPPSETTGSERTSVPPPRSPRPAETTTPAAADNRKSIVMVAESPIQTPTQTPTEAPAQEPKRGEVRDWKKAADSGRRTFEHPGEFAYTIQLELACEGSTVAKALGSDPSGRRVWIAPYDFRGRNCYRVLWGKYRDLAKARAAKESVPPVFRQNGNRPTVIALRSTSKTR